METALDLLKGKLLITTAEQDNYLKSILKGLSSELQKDNDLILNLKSNKKHLMFLVDYAEYRYNNRDKPRLPKNLQKRLQELMIKKQKNNSAEKIIPPTLPTE